MKRLPMTFARASMLAAMFILATASLHALGPCAPSVDDSKVVRIERALELGTSQSEILLSALVNGPEDIVEAGWTASGSLACLGLLAGRSVDLQLIAMQLATAPVESGTGKRAVVTLRRLRHPADALLEKTPQKERPCASTDEPIDAIKRGILHFKVLGPRTHLAADCFSVAARTAPDSLPANLGAAMAFAIAREYSRATEFYEQVSRLDPPERDDDDVQIARFPAFSGHPTDSVDRLLALKTRPLQLETQVALYGLLKGYGEDLGQAELIADAQAALVSALGRIRKLAPSAVRDERWWFENLELGGHAEGLGRFEEATKAYENAVEADSSERAQFLPDIGRIRIAIRTKGRTPQTVEECDKWRRRISSPTFQIDNRNSGGLELALGRIDFSCGDGRAAQVRIQGVISKHPSWDEPYRVLGEMLRAQGAQEQASRAFAMARDVKKAADAKTLQMIVREAQVLLADPPPP